jgi:hypothetical protein
MPYTIGLLTDSDGKLCRGQHEHRTAADAVADPALRSFWLMAPDPAALDRSVTALDYDQSGIAATYDVARALTPARRRHWQRLPSTPW